MIAALLGAGCKCIDPSQSARYLCTPEAGDLDQCPGGWRCALDGFCVNPEVGLPLPCRTDDHCTANWHCGPRGSCYDRADAGAIACRLDNTDCDDGWRCGLVGICHPLGAGAPYRCERDDDCEAQWRCGPDELCVDATADALRTTPEASGAFGARIHPVLPTRLADAVSINAFAGIVDCSGFTPSITTTSLAHGSRFTKLFSVRSGGWSSECPSDGGKPSFVEGDQRELDLPAAPLELLDQADHTLAVLADGGLLSIAYTPLMPLTVTALAPPFPILHLNGRSDGLTPEISVAFDSTRAALYEGGVFTTAPALPIIDGGVPTVFDALFDRQHAGNGALYVATDQGILESERTGGPNPLLLPWTVVFSFCDKRTSVLTMRLLDAEQRRFGVLTKSPGEPTRHSFLVPTELDAGTLLGCPYDPIDSATSGGAIAHLLQLDVGCGSFDEPKEYFGVALTDGGFDGVLRATPSGGAGLVTSFCGTARPFDAFGQDTRMSTTSGTTLGVTDAWGGLWLLRNRNNGVHFEALTLSARPTGVSGSTSSALASVAASLTGSDGRQTSVGFERAELRRRGAQGFVRSGSLSPLLATVVGQPKWQLTSIFNPQASAEQYAVVQQLLGDEGGLVALQGTVLQPPFTATVSTSASGRAALVIGAGQVLAHADVTGVDGGFHPNPDQYGLAPAIKFAATPLTGGTITSLVGVPGGSQPLSSYALGYLIVSGRVFRYKADNPVVFRTDELVIEPNEAISVWADGPRARVGFASGTVYGLPSRAKLAGPVGGASPVQQFATVCGHTFALTSVALWRLEVAQGATVGVWKPVPLESDDAGVPLAGAVLYGDDQGLLVARDRGYVDELRAFTCAP